MQKKRLFIGCLIIGILFISGFGVVYRTVLAADLSAVSDKFQILFDIYQLISKYYVDEVDGEKLLTGAIKGMAAELDPYSLYLEEEAYTEMQSDLLEGVFGGVGIIITIRDNQLTIVSPIKDTPGERAGLTAGDKILEIDGQSTEGISTKGAAKLMHGEPGTEVVLTVQHENEQPKIVTIVRAMIEVPFLSYEMLEDNIGYLNLYEFGAGVGQDVAKALKDLDKQGLEGIIIDLRTNPGGLLNEAVNVASSFMPKGPVVHICQRNGIKETLYVNRFMKHYELPLIVLVNGGSASASEIVAGAFQDTGVGTLLGTKTFGKGTVQSVVPLSDGGAFKITVAKYYTPDDRFIHEDGIEPDIVEEFDIERYKADGTDNQLEKAIELLKKKMDQNLQQKLKSAS